MSIPSRLSEEYKPISCLQPAADAGGRTGVWISMKLGHKVAIAVHIAQGNAATILLSLLQAQDVSGTGSKAGPAVAIYTNEDVASSDALTVQPTWANTWTTAATVKNKLIIFEMEAAQFDAANGFFAATISTGPSNAANVTSAVFYAVPRFAGPSAPSMIV
jgi:hypothetical protein